MTWNVFYLQIIELTRAQFLSGLDYDVVRFSNCHECHVVASSSDDAIGCELMEG